VIITIWKFIFPKAERFGNAPNAKMRLNLFEPKSAG
jgi:hypothetical protein